MEKKNAIVTKSKESDTQSQVENKLDQAIFEALEKVEN